MPLNQPALSPPHRRENMIDSCPACGYKDAFAITECSGKQLFHCFAGCSQNDLIAAMRGRKVTHPASNNNIGRGQDKAGIVAYIEKLWINSIAAQGTVVEDYLKSRGLAAAISPSIHFVRHHLHKPTGTYWPIMLAAVTDWKGHLKAIHRTYLAQDGKSKAPIIPAKMTLGAIGGFAVYLAPAAEKMVVTEGIETGLSMQQILYRGGWLYDSICNKASFGNSGKWWTGATARQKSSCRSGHAFAG